MKFLWNDKDGGPESKGWIWGLEIKSLFSILVVRFLQGTRPVYHTHAFSAISWLFAGGLKEETLGYGSKKYFSSFIPIWTPWHRYHQVAGIPAQSWAITFRGPWRKTWTEYNPATQTAITLAHGRKIV